MKNQRLREPNPETRSAQKKLSIVKAQIKDSKRYLKEQEIIVNETVAEWNSQLVGFRQEIDVLHDEKEKILRDVVRLQEDKKILEEAVSIAEDKLVELENVYQEKASQYRDVLYGLSQQITKKESVV